MNYPMTNDEFQFCGWLVIGFSAFVYILLIGFMISTGWGLLPPQRLDD